MCCCCCCHRSLKRRWSFGGGCFRDFAYVARDRNSRRFMCHVFRCDTPAKTIANTLRDICKRLMLHRRPSSLHAIDAVPERRVIRSQFQAFHRRCLPSQWKLSPPADGLTTPNEEPKKVIRCHFLGVTQVPRATGIEILNEAVDRLVSQVGELQRAFVRGGQDGIEAFRYDQNDGFSPTFQ